MPREAINHNKRDGDQHKPLYFLVLFSFINQWWNVCSTQSDVNALHSSYFTLGTKREWIISVIVSLKQEIQTNPTTWMNYGKCGSVISKFELLRERFDD